VVIPRDAWRQCCAEGWRKLWLRFSVPFFPLFFMERYYELRLVCSFSQASILLIDFFSFI
jgi:hypothetical protein